MAKILVVYGSTEGHTRRVAEWIATTARNMGREVALYDAGALDAPLKAEGDAVIIGASVHQGHHQTSVSDFVQAHRGLLERCPSAFFSVSLSAAVDDAMHQAEARAYVDAFLEETDWQPQVTATFAGALRHAEYDYFKHLVLQLLAGQLGQGTVRAQDVDYTDWDAVTRFTQTFLRELSQQDPRLRREGRADPVS